MNPVPLIKFITPTVKPDNSHIMGPIKEDIAEAVTGDKADYEKIYSVNQLIKIAELSHITLSNPSKMNKTQIIDVLVSEGAEFPEPSTLDEKK